jgi:hypothetical protein
LVVNNNKNKIHLRLLFLYFKLNKNKITSFNANIFNEFYIRLMAEEHQSPSTSDHPNINTSTTETKTSNQAKKNDTQKENSLYTEPLPKCYIGQGNNSEL